MREVFLLCAVPVVIATGLSSSNDIWKWSFCPDIDHGNRPQTFFDLGKLKGIGAIDVKVSANNRDVLGPMVSTIKLYQLVELLLFHREAFLRIGW